MNGVIVCSLTVLAAWFVQVWIMGMVDANERRSLLRSFASVKGIALVPTVMVLLGGCAQEAHAYAIGALDYVPLDCEGDLEDDENAASDAVIGPEVPAAPIWYALPATAMLAVLPRRFRMELPVLREIAKGADRFPGGRSGASSGRVAATNRPASWLFAFINKK